MSRKEIAEFEKSQSVVKSDTSAPAASEGYSKNNVMGDLTGTKISTDAYTSNSAVDNSSTSNVTDNSSTTSVNTTSSTVYNQTIVDDTKKTVVCEVSGRTLLAMNSAKCAKCNRVVANQYYDESKRRCSICETEAEESYKKFYSDMISSNGVIDQKSRNILNKKSDELLISDEKREQIEISIRNKSKRSSSKKLSDLKQKEFDRDILYLQTGRADIKIVYQKVEALAKTTDDETVCYWYYLLQAVMQPAKMLNDLQKSTVDVYWQQFWAFAAALNSNNISKSLDLLDEVKANYPDFNNDIIFAQSVFNLVRYLHSGEKGYYDDAVSDFGLIISTDSELLSDFYTLVEKVLYHTKTLQQGCSPAEAFFILYLLKCPQLLEKPAEQAEQPKPTEQPAQAAQASQTAPTPQKTEQSKSFQLDDSAGAPLDVESIQTTQRASAGTSSNKEDKKEKKSGGGMVAIIIIILALVAGAAAYLFVFSSDSSVETTPPVVETPKVEPKVTPKAEPTPAPIEQPKPKVVEKKAEPVAEKKAEPKPVVVEKPVVEVEKVEAGKESYEKGLKEYEAANYNAAMTLFKSAANEGSAKACRKIAEIYTIGVGPYAKNAMQAKMWSDKAVKLE